MGDIKISEDNFTRIVSVAGYPAIPLEVLEYTPEDIKNIIIREALEDYWSRFPLQHATRHSVAGSFSIEYPEVPVHREVFGVVDARITPRSAESQVTGNPFFDTTQVTRVGAGSYAGRFDVAGRTSFSGPSFHSLEAQISDRMVAGAMRNYNSGSRIRVDLEVDAVKGHTVVSGELLIKWAQISEDFEEVPLKHRKEVVWLAQSLLLRRLAMLRSQSNSNMGVDFNISEFTKEAENLERKVRDKWKQRKAVVVLRA